MAKFLKNKKILITGGTGSFGEALLKKIYSKKINVSEIRIFSRDEKKQDDMRKNFNSPKIKFHIGDVRDKNSLNLATQNIDYIFHAAALKQVPSCEFYPLEAMKTNVEGTNNLIDVAIENNVKKIVCLSTDKAVYPINAMGISKALMEKVAVSKSLLKIDKTSICVTRYGNVIGSRGSVIPLMINQIKNNLPITITSSEMTRFLMSLDDAMDLVFYAFENGKNGQTFIKKTDAAYITEIANAVIKIMGKKNYPIKNIGIRHGEKLHESLLSAEERSKCIDKKNFFILDPDTRNLNYNIFYNTGKKKLIKNSYTSNNTKMLSRDEIVIRLKKLDYIQQLL